MRRRHQRGRSARLIGRQRKLVLFIVGLLFGGTIWFAPTFVVHSPLRERFLRTATAGIDGTVSVGRISAGWLSPVIAHDLVLIDSDGQPLFEAESLATESPLALLLVDRQQVGTLRVMRPRLNLELRPDGSNLEDAVRVWLQQPSTSQSAATCTVEIVEGRVDVSELSQGRTWSVDKLSASFDVPNPGAGAISSHLNAEITPQNGHPGSLSVELLWHGTRDEADLNGTGSVSFQTARVPLPLVEALLRRFDSDMTLDGTLSGNVQAKWGSGRMSLQLADVEVQGLSLAVPRYLGSDRLRSQSLRVHGSATSAGANWQVDGLTLESDFLNFQGSGAGTVPSSKPDLRQLAQAWQHGNYQLGGTIDLAKLAQMLPSTLRIREGTYISSGRVSFALFGKPQGNVQVWDGRLETSQLGGMHRGQPIIWDKPVQLALQAQRQSEAFQVQRLTCRASFLDISAQGTAQEGSIVANGDLSRFASEIERFVNLGDLRLAGQLHTEVQWRQDSQGRVGLQGTAEAKHFEFATADNRPWREEHLRITLSARGVADARGLQRLEQAALALDSAGDHFQAELLEPVAPVSLSGRWPLSLQLGGELRSWLPRVQRFIDLPPGDLQGAVEIKAESVAMGDRVEIRSGKLRATDLQLDCPGFAVREPALELETTGSWHPSRRELMSQETTLSSSSLAIRADELIVRLQPDAMQVSGNLGYRGDLARLYAWFQVDKQPPAQRISGELTGRLRLAHQDGTTNADWTADVTQLAVLRRNTASGVKLAQASTTNPWKTIWTEPRMTVEAKARYDHVRDQVHLDQLKLAGESISLAAQGKVQQPWTRGETELRGQVAYDLERLSRVLKDQLGDAVQLVGRDSRPFTFQGPLFGAPSAVSQVSIRQASSRDPQTVAASSVLTEMIVRASLSWTSASVQGFVVGAGELQTQLSDGVLQMASLDLPASEGRIRFEEPRLDLRGEAPTLLVPRGSLQQVRVAPEMCRTWMKYIAPLVADATAAEGVLSLSIEEAAIPVGKPHAGQLNGVLTVHSARIGPGPMAREFLWIAEQVKNLLERRPLSIEYNSGAQWLSLPEQQFAFRLENQRVHHRDLQMMVEDVIIRTTGSVGFDQTVVLMAEVPIRDEWITGARYLAPLRGQVLKFPIHGTLSNPRLDRQILKQLSAQLLTETATGAASKIIERGLNRGLERLFGPPQN